MIAEPGLLKIEKHLPKNILFFWSIRIILYSYASAKSLKIGEIPNYFIKKSKSRGDGLYVGALKKSIFEILKYSYCKWGQIEFTTSNMLLYLHFTDLQIGKQINSRKNLGYCSACNKGDEHPTMFGKKIKNNFYTICNILLPSNIHRFIDPQNQQPPPP